jgi:hypothetical protein
MCLLNHQPHWCEVRKAPLLPEWETRRGQEHERRKARMRIST